MPARYPGENRGPGLDSGFRRNDERLRTHGEAWEDLSEADS